MDIHLKYASNGAVDEETINHIRLVANQHGNLSEQTWGRRGGAIDLVTIIEITGLFVGKKVLDGFIEGFVGRDIFVEIGRKTRTSILSETKKLSAFVKDLYEKIVAKNKDRYGAFVLVEYFNDLSLYAVVNHKRMNIELIEKLPESIINAIAILTYLNIGDDSPKVAQLYPNFETNTWDYILIPTSTAFGNYVDRYIDIKDKCIYEISTIDDFISLFKPDDRDDFKFLISSERDLFKFTEL